jgi:hypothetical protein
LTESRPGDYFKHKAAQQPPLTTSGPTLTRSKNQQKADALFALRLEAARFEQSIGY